MCLVNGNEAVPLQPAPCFFGMARLLCCFSDPMKHHRQCWLSGTDGNVPSLHGGSTNTRPWPVFSVPSSSPSRPVSTEIGETWGAAPWPELPQLAFSPAELRPASKRRTRLRSFLRYLFLLDRETRLTATPTDFEFPQFPFLFPSAKCFLRLHDHHAPPAPPCAGWLGRGVTA